MSWPAPEGGHVAAFRARGWLALEDAVPPDVIDDLARRCERVHTQPGLALDWQGRNPQDEPGDHVLQSMLELVWIDWQGSDLARWSRDFASALLGGPAWMWYDQLLDKPPLHGAATWWHQDGASLGAGVGERLVTAWLALDAVDARSGCMHFADRGHREGIIGHEHLSDLDCGRGACPVDPARVVAVPLPKGGITFHHGLTPHMAPANRSDRWRQVLIQRFLLGPAPDHAARRAAST